MHDSPNKKIKANKRVIFNAYCTEYEVVWKVARKILNYKVKYYPED